MDSGRVIRGPRAQRLFDSSPGLIAVFHALRRLLAPRHPPHALSSLAALASRPALGSKASQEVTGATVPRCIPGDSNDPCFSQAHVELVATVQTDRDRNTSYRRQFVKDQNTRKSPSRLSQKNPAGGFPPAGLSLAWWVGRPGEAVGMVPVWDRSRAGGCYP
jgi:hypothetical protein